MTEPIRVAVLGFGLAGRYFHAPFIQAVPGLQLRAVVTADPGRRQAAREEYPEVAVLTRADDVLDDPGSYDLVVVATANVAHVPLATTALSRGLHVLVDKPLAADAASARELASRARAADRQLHVFQNRRYDSDFRTIRSLLSRGSLGTVGRFESRFERWKTGPGGGWRASSEPEQMGGVLYDLGAHLVDQALQLFGPARSVYAELESRAKRGSPDDDTFIAIRHWSGTVSHLWMSSVAAHQGPRFRLLGSRGAFVVSGLDGQEDALLAGGRPSTDSSDDWGLPAPGRVGVLSPEGQDVPLERGDYRDYYRDVAASLRGECPPPVQVSEVIAELEVLDAARRSAATMEAVALPVTQ